MIHSQFLKHTCSLKKEPLTKNKLELKKKKNPILSELFFVDSWFKMYLSKWAKQKNPFYFRLNASKIILFYLKII